MSGNRWPASARSDRRQSLSQYDPDASTASASLRTTQSVSSMGSARPPRFRSKSASEAGPGAPEMESVEVFVATWNMNNLKECTDSLEELLGVGNYQYDLYAIGTQEFSGNRGSWEQALLAAVGDSYQILHGQELMGIKLTLLIRKTLRRYVRKIESADLPTKLGGLMKTKGAVGIALTIGRSSFLFINSHLTAHQNNVKERNHDHHTISKELGLPLDTKIHKQLSLVSTPSRKTKRRSPVYSKYDYTFWMGDLNYRLDGVDRNDVVQLVANKDWKSLQSADQLLKQRGVGAVFDGFEEHPLEFGPTYKFDRASNVYDSSKKQRIPAWTDRILFRSGSGGARPSTLSALAHEPGGGGGGGGGARGPRQQAAIQCNAYESRPGLICSDHRPVTASFTVALHHGNGIPEPDLDVQTAELVLGMLKRIRTKSEGASVDANDVSMATPATRSPAAHGKVRRRKDSASKAADSKVCTIL